jgi:chemotaxis protein methyltransferase CheR
MTASQRAVDILSDLMLRRAGHVLSGNRQYRIESALAPLIRSHRYASLDELVDALAPRCKNDALETEVFEALLNNETYFFRDVAPFDLVERYLDQKLRDARPQRRLSIWCAGVSTGQEAYSLAMMFDEQAGRWPGWRIAITGTDISPAAIERARKGIYTQFEVQRGLSARRLVTYFHQQGGNWCLMPSLRQQIQFRCHDITREPPPQNRYDLILCRNVLLYLPVETRRAVFNRLHSVLADDGALILGAAETILGQTDMFVSDAGFRGLYRPRQSVKGARTLAG